ncbi:MAG: LysR family transcriptional regulator, partial [Altererythrobacter sp.]|nr:LysR family transcriptional regulator [Altererythrobacter sp.]
MDVWQLNLRQLRAAVAIAEVGSISAAAGVVNISQPAITQGLSKLEQQLGTPLFERSRTGMDATEGGEAFVQRMRAALNRINSPRVTMTQMKALIAIADAGSYARAAQVTGLTQPSLHRAIADLSLALNLTLVQRRGRGIMLTSRGRSLARDFGLAKTELESGLAELASLQARETGRIAIGAMPLSRARILPKAIGRFCAQYP